MKQKKYAGILKACLINIVNTNTVMDLAQKKQMNKVIYRADYRLPSEMRRDGYEAAYKMLHQSYHQRMIAGEV